MQKRGWQVSISLDFMQCDLLLEQLGIDRNKKNEDKAIGIKEKLK